MLAQPTSFLTYFTDAGPVVKSVMLLLLVASIFSWVFIIQRALYLRRVREAIHSFENQFWSGVELQTLFEDLSQGFVDKGRILYGNAQIFVAGFREFLRLNKQSKHPKIVMDGVERAMRIATARESEKLENHLPFLASVGSVSPYVGLFGTVWGIMISFHALGQGEQATIAMVAPGISEALIATAMGLFAAIPAVLAYNRYSSAVNRLLNSYETFQEEFHNILHRELALAPLEKGD